MCFAPYIFFSDDEFAKFLASFEEITRAAIAALVRAQVEVLVERYLSSRVDALQGVVHREVILECRRIFLEELATIIVSHGFTRDVLLRGVGAEGVRFFDSKGAQIMQDFMREYLGSNLDGIADGAILRVMNTKKFLDIIRRHAECSCRCGCSTVKREPSESFFSRGAILVKNKKIILFAAVSFLRVF